jgi:hypothetical protein
LGQLSLGKDFNRAALKQIDLFYNSLCHNTGF